MTDNTAGWLMESGYFLITATLMALCFVTLAILWMLESAKQITSDDDGHTIRIGA